MTFQKRSHNVKTNVEATFLKRLCAGWVDACLLSNKDVNQWKFFKSKGKIGTSKT